jgi:hypothetical protein
MNPPEIIQQALIDGVSISTDGAGKIELTGDQTMVDKWIPAIRENKVALLAALAPRKDSAGSPPPCQGCTRLDIVDIMGMAVPGCLYLATGEFFDGWRRLPMDLTKCRFN